MGQLYYEYATGHVSARKQFVEVDSLQQTIAEATAKGYPMWRSYYAYDESILDHFQRSNSVKTFPGSIAVVETIVDVDKGTMSDVSLTHRLREAVDWMSGELGLHDDDFQCYFSGTGFHIHMGNPFHFLPSPDLHLSVKETMKEAFPFGDVIYDKARLIRVPHTLNEKSHLYKIPLSYDEIYDLDMDAIKALALNPRTSFPVLTFNGSYPLEGRKRVPKNSIAIVKPQVLDQPTSFVTCMQTAFNVGPINGTRHELILRIASSWRRGGLPYSGTVQGMISWAPGMDPQEIERLVQDVYKTPLEYGCYDEHMAKYCSSKCRFYKHKNLSLEVKSMSTMEAQFSEFVQTDFEGRSFDLQDHFLTGASYKFYPNEFVLFFGDTKLGKTAFIQNLCLRIRPMKVLYVTMEVHENVIFRRFIQIQHGITKEEVMDEYRLAPSLRRDLTSALQHIHIIGQPHSLSEIETAVASHRPAVIVIDTTDGLVTKQKEMIAKTDELGIELKNLANRTGTIVIGIHHIPKGAILDMNGFRKRLNIHSARGAATLEQKADKIISIEAVPNQAMQRVIIGQGARDEGSFQLISTMDPNTFRFS